jgi:iron complex outermembrane receptor protein
LGVFWNMTERHELRLTYARKNHFPTMFQRYSTQQDRVLPNPDLGSEIANHFELGYRGGFTWFPVLSAAAYFSDVINKIVDAKKVSPDDSRIIVTQAANLDETFLYGIELAAEFDTPLNGLSGGAALSLNGYTLRYSKISAEKLSYYPALTGNLYLVYKPLTYLSLIPAAEYLASRCTDLSGAEELPAAFLVHFKASVDIGKHFTAAVGVENILDTYYEIRQYFPQPGRTYTLTLTARY